MSALLYLTSNFCIKGKVTLLWAPYHVGLIQGLLPVVQLFLQESLLFTEQLLQPDVICASR